MELKFKGQFNRDIDGGNRAILVAVGEAINNVKQARNLSQVHNFKKLDEYKTHYRIKIANDYRIGIIVRGNIVWFARFGHRSNFYKNFP